MPAGRGSGLELKKFADGRNTPCNNTGTLHTPQAKMKLRPNKYTARAKNAAYNEATRPTVKEPLLSVLDRKIEELLNYIQSLPQDVSLTTSKQNSCILTSHYQDEPPSPSTTQTGPSDLSTPLLLTPWLFPFEDVPTAEFYGAAIGAATYQRSLDRLLPPTDVVSFLEEVYNRGEMERYMCKECLGYEAVLERDVGLLVEVQAQGECVHWNEVSLGFLGRMEDAVAARIELSRGVI